MDRAPVATSSPLTTGQRLVSLGEVVFGSFLVIGHNVFHIVPNEVPFLFVLFWISLRLHEGSWRAPGLRRPESWPKTVAMALAGAFVLLFGSELLIQPLVQPFVHQPERVSSLIQTSALGWRAAARNLFLIWVFAALGEEVGYRGYLLTRAADVGGRSRLAYIVAAVFVAGLFGIGHYYKGPAGVIDSTYSGLVLGGVYLLSGRNLWAAILTHGISDTVAVLAVLCGWAN